MNKKSPYEGDEGRLMLESFIKFAEGHPSDTVRADFQRVLDLRDAKKNVPNKEHAA